MLRRCSHFQGVILMHHLINGPHKHWLTPFCNKAVALGNGDDKPDDKRKHSCTYYQDSLDNCQMPIKILPLKISNDRHWDQYRYFNQYWSVLIGIDRHWAMIEGVLHYANHCVVRLSYTQAILHYLTLSFTIFCDVPHYNVFNEGRWTDSYILDERTCWQKDSA